MTRRHCIRCYVSGQVQGVWYRAYTRDKAVSLGVTGYARNLPDGRVEVMACGAEQAVSALRDWLWEGSPGSAVRDVQWEAAPERGFTSFTTG